MIVRRSTYEALEASNAALQAGFEKLEIVCKDDLALIDGVRRERDGLSRERDNALAANAALRDEIAWLRAQVALKDEQLLVLRREGFQPPAPTPTSPEREAGLDLDVRKAIEGVASPGTDLWMAESARARREIALGRDPKVVAQEIARGSSLNPFHA